MIRLFSITLFLFSICFCHANSTELRAVVNLYDPAEQIELMRQEVKFWSERIESNAGGYIYLPKLAAAYKAEFEITGNPTAILKAGNYLEESLLNPLLDHVPVLVQLATVYMTQHRFCEALELLQDAQQIAPNKKSMLYALADVYAELGFTHDEKAILDRLGTDANFNHLVRLAKWYDGEGDLDLAIQTLEIAKSKLSSSHHKIDKKAAWLHANLGDFYGHAGIISKSKEHYIQALENDPASWHSAKGLAWIAYANNNQIEAAKDIVNYIQKWCVAPDLSFLYADLMEASGEAKKAEISRKKIVEDYNLQDLGDMYGKHLFRYKLHQRPETATIFALDLLSNRETPNNYAYLVQAMATTAKSDLLESISITQVYHETSEPALLLAILPFIKKDEIIRQHILDMLNEASYELGPLSMEIVEHEMLNNPV